MEFSVVLIILLCDSKRQNCFDNDVSVIETVTAYLIIIKSQWECHFAILRHSLQYFP